MNFFLLRESFRSDIVGKGTDPKVTIRRGRFDETPCTPSLDTGPLVYRVMRADIRLSGKVLESLNDP